MLTIPANIVRALLAFVPKKDVRFYLCGIKFDRGGYAMASNGTAGAMAQLTAVLSRDFIAPIELFEGIKSKGHVQIEIEDDDTITLTYGDMTRKAKAIDGTYPDLRRHFAHISGEAAAYGEAAFTVALAAQKALGTKQCTIVPNGTSAALIDFGRDDFTACVMPMRSDRYRKQHPDWAYADPL